MYQALVRTTLGHYEYNTTTSCSICLLPGIIGVAVALAVKFRQQLNTLCLLRRLLRGPVSPRRLFASHRSVLAELHIQVNRRLPVEKFSLTA